MIFRITPENRKDRVMKELLRLIIIYLSLKY